MTLDLYIHSNGDKLIKQIIVIVKFRKIYSDNNIISQEINKNYVHKNGT